MYLPNSAVYKNLSALFTWHLGRKEIKFYFPWALGMTVFPISGGVGFFIKENCGS